MECLGSYRAGQSRLFCSELGDTKREASINPQDASQGQPTTSNPSPHAMRVRLSRLHKSFHEVSDQEYRGQQKYLVVRREAGNDHQCHSQDQRQHGAEGRRIVGRAPHSSSP